MEPYYQDEWVTLYNADAFDILPILSGCHAVITDPPYMIGAKSVGGNKETKAGSWVDLMNASRWYEHWLKLSWSTMRISGYLIVFSNWRSLPMLLKACSDAEIPVNSCAVWDKEWIGPAYRDQLRPRYEMITFCAKGETCIPNRSASDVFRHKWMAGNNGKWHPAEKPLSLLCEIVELVTNPGDLVIDPFSGGATTLAAAKMAGRRAIGCEANEKYAEAGARRLEQTFVFARDSVLVQDDEPLILGLGNAR